MIATVVEDPIDVSRGEPRCLRLVLSIGESRIDAFEGTPLKAFHDLPKGTVLKVNKAKQCGSFLRLDDVDVVSKPTVEPPSPLIEKEDNTSRRAPRFETFSPPERNKAEKVSKKRSLQARVTDIALRNDRLIFFLSDQREFQCTTDLDALLHPPSTDDDKILTKLRTVFLQDKDFTFDLIRKTNLWEIRNIR